MALDDKDKKDIEVPFEGTIEIDPSSIKLEDDGSMSEPSFSSVEEVTRMIEQLNFTANLPRRPQFGFRR